VNRSAWWVRWIAALPLPLLYSIAGIVSWLACRVFPHREHVVRENLTLAFPELNEAQLREVTCRFYMNFAQVFMEIVKSASLSPEELRRRVRLLNLELPRAELARGTPVLLVAAHQCNWEWMLLALSVELGYPVDAAYKPLVNDWAECEMFKIRTRFGARLVPGQELLADIIKRRKIPRGIALLADQEPTRSEHKHWVRFLNRDTAFFLGTEEIARATRYPVFFIALRRTARGFYEMEFKRVAEAGETLQPGELTERYARLVEEQIRASPPDWPWSHKRWRLKRSLYGRS
jgi:Kdo2-lipid IVA lauroyltransferase/acyltransferase